MKLSTKKGRTFTYGTEPPPTLLCDQGESPSQLCLVQTLVVEFVRASLVHHGHVLLPDTLIAYGADGVNVPARLVARRAVVKVPCGLDVPCASPNRLHEILHRLSPRGGGHTSRTASSSSTEPVCVPDFGSRDRRNSS